MNREDFPMLKQDIIYFDNGATTLKPKCVIDKVVEYYQDYTSNAHRGDYKTSIRVDMEYEGARNIVQDFINAKNREEVVFTSGTTESLNMIANGFFKNLLEPGDEILITKAEHASNVLPWFRLASEIGISIKYIELDDNHYVTLENVKKAITPATKVISLAHITNVIGDIRPIKEISKFAHENDIFVVCDAAQSAPHIKIDVQDLDVDFLAFSGHKMLGPTGIGVLYGKKELLNNLVPTNFGGGMNESFDDPNKFTMIEVSNGNLDEYKIPKGFVEVTNIDKYQNKEIYNGSIKNTGIIIEGTDAVGKSETIKRLLLEGIICKDRESRVISANMLFDIPMEERAKKYEEFLINNNDLVIFLINNDKEELLRRVHQRNEICEFERRERTMAFGNIINPFPTEPQGGKEEEHLRLSRTQTLVRPR